MPPTKQRTRAKPRAAGSARTDVLNMLKDDHKRAKKAFQEFDRLDPEEAADECQALVDQTCAELALHMQLEEECFYPAVRGALGETDLIDEAEVEHQSAKTMIADLEQMPPDGRAYGATFRVLGEYIQHHIQEEEGELFPKLTKATIDWDGLRDQMTARRAALQQELMPDDEGWSEDAEVAPRASRPAQEERRQTAAGAHHDDDE